MTDFHPGAAICPTCGETYYRDIVWKRVCLDCYLVRKGKTAAPTAHYAVRTEPQIEPDMIRRLVQLCHPDRHGNSEAANIATRYLLTQKEAAHG